MEKSIVGNVSAELFSELISEYGMGFQHWGDVRYWSKVTAPHKARHVTRQGYVNACRQLFFRGNQALLKTDHRLIQAGFNRVSPTVWLGGELDRFLEYWKAAAPRPETVGSPWNPDPEDAYRAMQAGLPAWAARAGRFIRGRKRPTRSAYKRHMNQARALTRMSGAFVDGAAGADLLALMGKLSSLWQWAVVHYIQNSQRGFDGKRWRVRDIPWDTLREHLSRKNILGFLDALEPGDGGLHVLAPGHFWDGMRRCALIEWLCPSYPKVDWTNAINIAKGMTPVQLSGGVLTKKEAHQWLLDGGPWLVGWLCEKYNIRAPLDHIRSPLVAKWLAAVERRGAWGQLTRVRRAHGPAGAQGEYTFLQKLDEIQDIDLVNGEHTTVEFAFESAAQRVYEAYESQAEADNTPLNEEPRARILPRCSRWLLSAAELVKEGREMQHCVGSYTYAVKEGQCAILALCVRYKGEDLRSTVEFALYGRKLGEVRQHYGPGNTEPHPVLLRVVRQIERMNREYTPFDNMRAGLSVEEGTPALFSLAPECKFFRDNSSGTSRTTKELNMEHVTRESVLKDALRLYFDGVLHPHTGHFLSLNFVDSDDVDQDGREDFLRSTPAVDYLPEHCVGCALGGMLYAFLQQNPKKTLREAWPHATLLEVLSVCGYSIEVASSDCGYHPNVAFLSLEELFTRRELHCIERAFEIRDYSVQDEHPMDARDWRAAVTGWLESSASRISNVSARYVQALANALRHDGTFDPQDLRMLSIAQLEELCASSE